MTIHASVLTFLRLASNVARRTRTGLCQIIGRLPKEVLESDLKALVKGEQLPFARYNGAARLSCPTCYITATSPTFLSSLQSPQRMFGPCAGFASGVTAPDLRAGSNADPRSNA